MSITINRLLAAAAQKLKARFEYIQSTNPHYGEAGQEKESALIEFLNDFLPRRYAAGTGIIIDNKNAMSPQTDVIVYDALNSAVYRKDERVQILPSDNVAAVIEVKTRLNKKELIDAAEKIRAVKSLAKTPITNRDEPVNAVGITVTKTMGIVFAYSADTSLETLGENLVEINTGIAINKWIDLIVVLDAGTIRYMSQLACSNERGTFFGALGTDVHPAPVYISVVISSKKDETINELCAHLMEHLALFRKRPTVDRDAFLPDDQSLMVINSFQLDSHGHAHPADPAHVREIIPFQRSYDLVYGVNRTFVGQFSFLRWLDDAVLLCVGRLPWDDIVNECISRKTQVKFSLNALPNGRDSWVTSVIPVTLSAFECFCEKDLHKWMSSEIEIIRRPEKDQKAS